MQVKILKSHRILGCHRESIQFWKHATPFLNKFSKSESIWSLRNGLNKEIKNASKIFLVNQILGALQMTKQVKLCPTIFFLNVLKG